MFVGHENLINNISDDLVLKLLFILLIKSLNFNSVKKKNFLIVIKVIKTKFRKIFVRICYHKLKICFFFILEF